jgi:ATP-binding cassette subfamily F protein 3
MSKKQESSSTAPTILSFDEVSFGYGAMHPILDAVSFSVRQGSKTTIMGQNGAGKSTLFSLITKEQAPDEGDIIMSSKVSVAIAKQILKEEEKKLTVREYFALAFDEKKFDIDGRIEKICGVVNVHAPVDKLLSSFSGGQQSRLLLAFALIQNPDVLLLDEPTNNLDHDGIEHLTNFIQNYPKTVIVISHDAEFLNSFTDGVLYLDVRTKKIEQYRGTYFDVQKDIAARIERENRKNAQLAKKIQENKDKVNFFAQKGGKMRLVAKRMRDDIEEMEEEIVDVRKEDKTIRPFIIPVTNNALGEVVAITSLTIMDTKKHVRVQKKASVSLKKKTHLHLIGPNGVGKSTLLNSIAHNNEEGVAIQKGLVVGYYRQDFSTLDFNKTVFEELNGVMKKKDEERLRSVAATFLLTGEVLKKKVGVLSEGQKGLVAFASLVLLAPDVLILDEPTNHINFRHLPVIAEALNAYEGVMLLVSHVPDFVAQIRIDEQLDLGAL